MVVWGKVPDNGQDRGLLVKSSSGTGNIDEAEKKVEIGRGRAAMSVIRGVARKPSFRAQCQWRSHELGTVGSNRQELLEEQQQFCTSGNHQSLRLLSYVRCCSYG